METYAQFSLLLIFFHATVHVVIIALSLTKTSQWGKWTVVSLIDPISHEKREFASKSGFTALSKHDLRVSTI